MNIPAGGTNLADATAIGAPNYYRIFDYAHVPSRFSHTDTMLPPSLFNVAGSITRGAAPVVPAVDPVRADPRWGLTAPFNRVDNYSEPGRINLNTIVGNRAQIIVPQRQVGSGATQVWSDVYDGLMHRRRDGASATLGHLGPAWRDVVRSRRGYFTPAELGGNTADIAAHALDNNFPTLFANPFRAPNEGELVPLPSMVRNGIEGTLLRPHHFVPGERQAWGEPGIDDDRNGWVDDVGEAGLGGGDAPFTVALAAGGGDASRIVRHPLFSAGALGPTTGGRTTTSNAIDALRNPGMQYQPITRIENLTTTRSGVFAVWVTVGYFEVSRAPSWDDPNSGVADKFTNQAGGDAQRGRALYNAVYPEGYQLGKELGIDIGEVERHRAFYLIDRTRPVGFKPGEDVNVEDAILLRRRIE